VNGGANLFPHIYVGIYQAAINRNFDLLHAWQSKVLEISSRPYRVGTCSMAYLKGLKAALAVMGICQDGLSPPLQRFTGEEKEKVKAFLEAFKENAATLPTL
jgi:4-hydroxy-tetrahydrodipicolinate synthase